MKKVLSLILAVAMVLSLASVAFAAYKDWTPKESSSTAVTKGVVKYDNTSAFTYDKDGHFFTKLNGKTTFGKTIYYPLFVSDKVIATQDKAVSSLKLDYKIENAAAYVKSVSIVKKYGYVSDEGYKFYDADKATETDAVTATNKTDAYYIAVETQGSATSDQYVSGVITLTGKTGDAKLKDEAVHFDFTLAWKAMDTDTNNKNFVIKLGSDNSVTRLADSKKLVSNTSLEEVEFTVDNYEEVKFTVDMVTSEKVVVKYSDAEVDAIVDANEEAGITFYNFNNATFKRSGDLFFEQDLEDEDAYLYEIMADGSLKNLSSCYDEEEGGFLLKVKKLGAYCISDLPLVDAEGTVAAVAGAVNPVTGAIA